MRHNPYDQRAPCNGYDAVIRVPEKDHTKLDKLDEPNQHPIKAIKGLNKQLNDKVSKTSSESTMSILEIDAILRG